MLTDLNKSLANNEYVCKFPISLFPVLLPKLRHVWEVIDVEKKGKDGVDYILATSKILVNNDELICYHLFSDRTILPEELKKFLEKDNA